MKNLNIELEMRALDAERDAMREENFDRDQQGYAHAYGPDAFFELAERYRKLKEASIQSALFLNMDMDPDALERIKKMIAEHHGQVVIMPNEEFIPVQRALNIILQYGGIDGEHHKTWVIDQVVRILTGDKYEEWVRDACDGEDGPNTYGWDVGIAP